MIYEYFCPNHRVIEIEHSAKELRRKCPMCGSPIKRQISGGIQVAFKGPGWAKDGYGYREGWLDDGL